jgi:hypothetical protein
MVANNTDPVLLAVGIILFIAVGGLIIISAVITPENAGNVQLSSSSPGFEGVSCSSSHDQHPAECNREKCEGCPDKAGCMKKCRNTPLSCQNG